MERSTWLSAANGRWRGRCSVEQAVDQQAVADVALHKDVARVARRRPGSRVAGVGEGVEVDDGLIVLARSQSSGAGEAGRGGLS